MADIVSTAGADDSGDDAALMDPSVTPDPRQPTERLLRDLRSRRGGLGDRDAARRLLTYGPNELRRTAVGSRWTELVHQFTHPLALLLWVAAVLATAAGTPILSVAIVLVIFLNAAFAFWQEQQAERAVEALGGWCAMG